MYCKDFQKGPLAFGNPKYSYMPPTNSPIPASTTSCHYSGVISRKPSFLQVSHKSGSAEAVASAASAACATESPAFCLITGLGPRALMKGSGA